LLFLCSHSSSPLGEGRARKRWRIKSERKRGERGREGTNVNAVLALQDDRKGGGDVVFVCESFEEVIVCSKGSE